jgi:hypothetical protein
VAEGYRIFRSHGPWMEATHHRTGDKALLSYNVSKASELSNPVDSNSAPTGNTLFILNEITRRTLVCSTTSRCPNRGRTSQPFSSGSTNAKSRVPVLADFLQLEPRQEPEGVRKLAGEGLNLNNETGGKAGLTPASRPGNRAKANRLRHLLTI